MNNSIIKYDKIISDDYEYNDYTSRNHRDISKLSILNSSEFIEYITVSENDKIERISHQIYGTTNYWDLLILINNRDPLFDMLYDFDLLSSVTSKQIDDYNNTNFNGTLPILYVNELKDSFLEKLELANESFRILKIIKPHRLQDFIQIINEDL